MNLGDGLMLETQVLNGKTRLILAPYGVQEKTSKQAGNRGRTHKPVLKTKNPVQVLHSIHNNSAKTESAVVKPRSGGVVPSKLSANVLKELENKHDPVAQQNMQPRKPDAGKVKILPKKATNGPKQRLQQKPAISADELKESLVCLTQEQFQQILLTINHGAKPGTQDQTAEEDQDKQDLLENAAQPPSTEESSHEISKEKGDPGTAEQTKDMQTGSLFNTLGERERDKSLQEAKKAQWRRELDEQVALKKKLKEADQDGINVRHHEVHSRTSSERTPFSDLPKSTSLNYETPEQEDLMFKTPTVTETTSSSPVGRPSSFSSPELPAAIRSAFVLGEAAPLDHPFSAVKRQQQKKWLEELNKQREEDTLRKMREKQKFQETIEQDHWAMHFDSFKKQTDYQTPMNQNTAPFQQHENPLSTSDPAPAEQVPASAASNFHQELSETMKSTEEGQFQSQKSGFLRTMTSLLDPVQIEERDRKRLKQLEHQKAIAAQVEQRRQKKQMEDEQRQQEEQEEERRLARERELMQKQYEEDSFKQKQKEEILTLKTRELYQSMQRAQEEAQRLKQEQRMRHLLQKGHDVSNLQKNVSGNTVSIDSDTVSRSADVVLSDYENATNRLMKQSVPERTSPRKDTAVQTDDLDVLLKSDFASDPKGMTWRHKRNGSPDIPIEFNDQQPKAELQAKKTKPLRDRTDSRKENTNIYNDVYEQYARTETQVKEPVRKPDWNKNKPHKKFVPASERYPKGLQKQREESKVRRQMELLHLVEKNSSNKVPVRKANSPEKSPVRQEEAKISRPREDGKPAQEAKKEDKFQKVDSSFKRSDSPPVPAVKNRLHQAQKRSSVTPAPVYTGNAPSTQRNVSPNLDKQESERPPSSQFIPYVRTKEIYYLDPDAPMSRPSTNDPQYKWTGSEQASRQVFSSDHATDPLLNPHIIRNKDRQQAILKGLSELRKGLLQKQRELETGLMPDV